jgi:hypothetical protein
VTKAWKNRPKKLVHSNSSLEMIQFLTNTRK